MVILLHVTGLIKSAPINWNLFVSILNKDGACWRWGGRLPRLANRNIQNYILIKAHWSTQWTSVSNSRSTSVIGGSKGRQGRDPRVQIFSFSCSFKQKVCNTLGVGTPSGKPGSATECYQKFLYINLSFLHFFKISANRPIDLTYRCVRLMSHQSDYSLLGICFVPGFPQLQRARLPVPLQYIPRGQCYRFLPETRQPCWTVDRRATYRFSCE